MSLKQWCIFAHMIWLQRKQTSTHFMQRNLTHFEVLPWRKIIFITDVSMLSSCVNNESRMRRRVWFGTMQLLFCFYAASGMPAMGHHSSATQCLFLKIKPTKRSVLCHVLALILGKLWSEGVRCWQVMLSTNHCGAQAPPTQMFLESSKWLYH